MKYYLSLLNSGPCGDARRLAEFALCAYIGREWIPADVRELKVYIGSQRTASTSFDIVISGLRHTDPEQDKELRVSLAEAGVTDGEYVPPAGIEELRRAIIRGPLHIDQNVITKSSQ